MIVIYECSDTRYEYDMICRKNTGYMVHDSWYMVHGTRFMVHGTLYTLHGTLSTFHGTWYMVHDTWYTVHGTRYMVHDTRYKVFLRHPCSPVQTAYKKKEMPMKTQKYYQTMGGACNFL